MDMHPVPEEDEPPPIPRRGEWVTPPWFQEDGPTEASVAAQEESRLASRIWGWVAVTVALLMISLAIGQYRQYQALPLLARPGFALSFFYGVMIQIAGWWFAVWAFLRR